MKKNTLMMLGLAGAGVAAFTLLAGKKGDKVVGRSGKPWRVVLLSNVEGTKTYEVFTPEKTWGPHPELSVVRYQQTGSDTSRRPIVGTGAGVPAEIVNAAVSDFGLSTTGGILGLGTSA